MMRPTARGTLLLVISALPWLILMPLGLLWLWQHDAMLWWLIGAVVITVAGWAIRYWVGKGDTVEKPGIRADRYWPERGQAAWQTVERQAAALRFEDYPLDQQLPHRLLDLGLGTVRDVAHHYHPEAREPELEVALPQILLTTERVCRDLRRLTDYVPLSHRITLAQWKRVPGLVKLSQLYDIWRMARLVMNPFAAAASEARAAVQGKLLNQTRDELLLWLLQEFVKGTGRHAIDLYSGQLLLDHAPSPGNKARSPTSPEPPPEEPFRVLLLGQTGSGKSSLINALLGKYQARTDTLSHTWAFAAYRLQRPGLPVTMLLDSPGYASDLPAAAIKALDRELLRADLVLLVCAAHHAGRAADRDILDHLRALYRARPERNPPALLCVVNFIDRLRPPREWSPPYDFDTDASAKARSIRDAVTTVAELLALDETQIVPVRTDAGKVYNVTESLLPRIRASLEDDAERARYLRWLRDQQQSMHWRKVLRQTGKAGRLLGSLGGQLGGRLVKRGRNWLSGKNRS